MAEKKYTLVPFVVPTAPPSRPCWTCGSTRWHFNPLRQDYQCDVCWPPLVVSQ